MHYPELKTKNRTSETPYIPQSFRQACKDPKWAAAIDREYGSSPSSDLETHTS